MKTKRTQFFPQFNLPILKSLFLHNGNIPVHSKKLQMEKNDKCTQEIHLNALMTTKQVQWRCEMLKTTGNTRYKIQLTYVTKKIYRQIWTPNKSRKSQIWQYPTCYKTNSSTGVNNVKWYAIQGTMYLTPFFGYQLLQRCTMSPSSGRMWWRITSYWHIYIYNVYLNCPLLLVCRSSDMELC